MAQEEQVTKAQHYTPVVYLKNFSPEAEKDPRARKLNTLIINGDSCVSTKIAANNVCYENYMYELKDTDGNIILVNLLENKLAEIEGEFGKLITDLESKLFATDRYILNNGEKCVLLLFTLVQLMRSPKTIKMAEDFYASRDKTQPNKNLLRTAVLLNQLPFVTDIKIENTIMWRYLAQFLERDIVIFVDKNKKNKLLTCDNPVFMIGDEDDVSDSNYDVAIPLTPNMLLVLAAINDDTLKKSIAQQNPELSEEDRELLFNMEKNNCLYGLSDDMTESINYGMSKSAERFIFSYNEFSDEDIQRIKDVRSK